MDDDDINQNSIVPKCQHPGYNKDLSKLSAYNAKVHIDSHNTNEKRKLKKEKAVRERNMTISGENLRLRHQVLIQTNKRKNILMLMKQFLGL